MNRTKISRLSLLLFCWPLSLSLCVAFSDDFNDFVAQCLVKVELKLSCCYVYAYVSCTTQKIAFNITGQRRTTISFEYACAWFHSGHFSLSRACAGFCLQFVSLYSSSSSQTTKGPEVLRSLIVGKNQLLGNADCNNRKPLFLQKLCETNKKRNSMQLRKQKRGSNKRIMIRLRAKTHEFDRWVRIRRLRLRPVVTKSTRSHRHRRASTVQRRRRATHTARRCALWRASMTTRAAATTTAPPRRRRSRFASARSSSASSWRRARELNSSSASVSASWSSTLSHRNAASR